MVSQLEDRYMLYMLEQDRMARMSEDQNATSMDVVRWQRRLLVHGCWANSGRLGSRCSQRRAPPPTCLDSVLGSEPL